MTTLARQPTGRPLKFFGFILGAWITGRIAMTLPVAERPELTPIARAVPARATHRTLAIRPSAAIPAAPGPAAIPTVVALTTIQPSESTALVRRDPIRFSGRPDGSTTELGKGAPIPSFAQPAPALLERPGQPSATDRWRASGWILWRPDGIRAPSVAAAGQLGASQAGARIDWDVAPASRQRITAYARISRALVRPAQPEAAVGVSVQPSRRLPVSIALERRIALGQGGRNAMAAMVVGGFGPAPVAAGLVAEGYGQAGLVGLRARDRFVDGRLSLLGPLSGTPVTVGGTVSGGAQPGVHRVDIGPAVHVRLPVQPSAGRLMLEWRERIAGRAFPRSGLAVTLAADF